MYCDHWQLKELPFQNVADPRFFYHSLQHEEALSRFLWAVKERQGVFVLSGEYGCGKTLISRVVVRELAEHGSSQLALIVNPRLSAPEFLKMALYELGGRVEVELKVDILRELKQIMDSNSKANRGTALVVDDAQAIEDDAIFEEIRLLLNFQQDNALLLNLVLMGQPEVKERISRFKQLSQRVNLWFHLAPLSADDTPKYIAHRLNVAGRLGEIFTPEAMKSVYGITGGIPRLINNVCNMALMIGWNAKADVISETIVNEAARGINGE